MNRAETADEMMQHAASLANSAADEYLDGNDAQAAVELDEAIRLLQMARGNVREAGY